MKSYSAKFKSFCDEEIFLIPRPLPQKYIENCKLACDRYELLKHLPKAAKVAEIGTRKGDFARAIMRIATPSELHLFDNDFSVFDGCALDKENITLHEGDSSTLLSRFPNHYFDWIYIDGDHSFEGVTKDITQSALKVKPSGSIICNDYNVYSHLEKMQYGVMRAVNHFCLKSDYEIYIFAFSVYDYPDVALRKRSPGSI